MQGKNLKIRLIKDLLKKSHFCHKIELIEGDWETDEDERNTCLRKAKNDGFDFLIIQDADEFFIKDDYKKNIKKIIQNPDYELYTTPVRAFLEKSSLYSGE